MISPPTRYHQRLAQVMRRSELRIVQAVQLCLSVLQMSSACTATCSYLQTDLLWITIAASCTALPCFMPQGLSSCLIQNIDCKVAAIAQAPDAPFQYYARNSDCHGQSSKERSARDTHKLLMRSEPRLSLVAASAQLPVIADKLPPGAGSMHLAVLHRWQACAWSQQRANAKCRTLSIGIHVLQKNCCAPATCQSPLIQQISCTLASCRAHPVLPIALQ